MWVTYELIIFTCLDEYCFSAMLSKSEGNCFTCLTAYVSRTYYNHIYSIQITHHDLSDFRETAISHTLTCDSYVWISTVQYTTHISQTGEYHHKT